MCPDVGAASQPDFPAGQGIPVAAGSRALVSDTRRLRFYGCLIFSIDIGSVPDKVQTLRPSNPRHHMARYRKISPKIWNDAKFRSLSDNAKLVFFMLLTHPLTSSVGTLRAFPQGLAPEMGWSQEAFCKAFGEASAKGMVIASEKDGLIWLPNFMKYNAPESPNVLKSWAGSLDDCPECALKTEIYRQVKAFALGLGKAFREAFAQAFQEPLPNQEQEQDERRQPPPPPHRGREAVLSAGTHRAGTHRVETHRVGTHRVETHPDGEQAAETQCAETQCAETHCAEPQCAGTRPGKPPPAGPRTGTRVRSPTGNTASDLRQAAAAFTADEALRQALEDYRVMRERIRKPMTGKAQELIFGRLRQLSGGDEGLMVRILEQSTAHSWQGVFELKAGDPAAGSACVPSEPPPPLPTLAELEANAARGREWAAKWQAQRRGGEEVVQ